VHHPDIQRNVASLSSQRTTVGVLLRFRCRTQVTGVEQRDECIHQPGLEVRPPTDEKFSAGEGSMIMTGR